MFCACANSTQEKDTQNATIDRDTEICNERWHIVKDTIVLSESVEFKNFISPIDSIDAIISSGKSKAHLWNSDSVYHACYMHNGHPVKLLRIGTFESLYRHEFYLIDNCNAMLRRTDKYLEFPDSMQRIRTYGFNSDSICRAYITSPSLGYILQSNITAQSQSSFKTIRTWFTNELMHVK